MKKLLLLITILLLVAGCSTSGPAAETEPTSYNIDEYLGIEFSLEYAHHYFVSLDYYTRLAAANPEIAAEYGDTIEEIALNFPLRTELEGNDYYLLKSGSQYILEEQRSRDRIYLDDTGDFLTGLLKNGDTFALNKNLIDDTLSVGYSMKNTDSSFFKDKITDTTINPDEIVLQVEITIPGSSFRNNLGRLYECPGDDAFIPSFMTFLNEQDAIDKEIHTPEQYNRLPGIDELLEKYLLYVQMFFKGDFFLKYSSEYGYYLITENDGDYLGLAEFESFFASSHHGSEVVKMHPVSYLLEQQDITENSYRLPRFRNWLLFDKITDDTDVLSLKYYFHQPGPLKIQPIELKLRPKE